MRANRKLRAFLSKVYRRPFNQGNIQHSRLKKLFVPWQIHPEVSLLAALTQAEAEYDSLTRWCIRAPYRSCAC